MIQDKELALQFVNEFYTIKQHYFGGQSEKMVDNVKLCIRLEALKNVILLEDEEDISYQVLKLKKVLPAHDEQFLAVRQIVRETELKHYGSVVAQINEYVSKQRAISIYVDTEITAMHLEVKMLGLQISSLEDEKTEIEKMLYLFKLRHDRELGGLIVELLKLRHGKLKEKAKQDDKKRKEAEEAERDYSEYQKSYEESSLKKIAPLNETEEIELKIKFRKATKLCHPDVVNESQKEHAEIVFRALKEAYDNNNVQKIRDILSDLEQGVFAERSETISEKTELQAMVMQLRRRRDELEHALVELKKSETYRTVSQIDNWDNYFEDIKKQLEKDLEGIKEEK